MTETGGHLALRQADCGLDRPKTGSGGVLVSLQASLDAWLPASSPPAALATRQAAAVWNPTRRWQP